MQKIKTVQYYFDAKTYDKTKILENLKNQEKEEFFNKTAKINISLNEFGVYVATLTFEPKENHFLKIIQMPKKEKNVTKNEEKKSRYERLISTERKYGQYKQTKTYKPY